MTTISQHLPMNKHKGALQNKHYYIIKIGLVFCTLLLTIIPHNNDDNVM